MVRTLSLPLLIVHLLVAKCSCSSNAQCEVENPDVSNAREGLIQQVALQDHEVDEASLLQVSLADKTIRVVSRHVHTSHTRVSRTHRITLDCLHTPPISLPVALSLAVIIMGFIIALCWMLAGLVGKDARNVVQLDNPSLEMPSLCQKKPFVQCIEGLRTVVDAWIILGYMPNNANDHVPAWLQWVLNARGECGTRAAIQCMFIVSGFVLELGVDTGSFFGLRSGSAFVVRRIARIAPAYFASYLLAMFLLNWGYHNDAAHITWPLHSAFLQSLFPLITCDSSDNLSFFPWQVNWVSFSISAGVLFSIIFPWLHNWMEKLLGEPLKILCTAILVGALRSAFSIWMIAGTPRIHGMHLYLWAVPRFPDFLVGMLFAQLYKSVAPSTAKWHGWGLARDGIILAIFWMIFISPLGIDDDWGGDFFLAVPVGAMCFTACLAEHPSNNGFGVLGPVFSFPLLAGMGKYSYLAYVGQFSFGDLVDQFIPFRENAWVRFIFVYVAGIFFYYVWQRPFQGIIEQRLAACESL